MRRYAPTPGRDAREDRLTEALAATLEAAPEAGRWLVGRWFRHEPVGQLHVETQRWVGPGERIDLELVFGSVNRPELRVWFEAKVDADAVAEQPTRYLHLLEQLPGRSHLSWLLPVGAAVKGGSPDGVREHTWQALASELDRWLRHLDENERHSYAAGVVREFNRHLEEEGLAVTQPLNAQDVAAFEGFPVANARMVEILRLATSQIVARRGHRNGRNWFPRTAEFWEHVGHDELWPESAFFEWYGGPDAYRHDPAGKWVIGAGVSWEQGSEPSERVHPDWFGRRYAEGFEYGASRRKMVYLLRYFTPADLAAYPTLDEQADSLARWALATWDLLESDPL